MNSLKKGEGVPLLNFEGGPGVLPLNFEGGPGVPLLNFRGVLRSTLKLWGRSRVPGPMVPGSWSHFYTMPSVSLLKATKYSKQKNKWEYIWEYIWHIRNLRMYS